MKVKVEDKVYDGEKEPVMLILDDYDRKNIANMNPECTRYCMYPEGEFTVKQIRKWMLNPPKEDWENKTKEK